MAVYAQGPEYTAEPKPETYYTKEDCVVYAEPTYTSTILTTIGANVPVQVIGSYSNGWYRINIGVICYVKMDSLTTAGAIGIKNNTDVQIADAKKIADEMGYQFVYLTLNKEKKIEKEIFNSYIGQKVILYAKIDDEVGVSFKMLYNDEVKRDINLKYTKQVTPPPKPADGIPTAGRPPAAVRQTPHTAWPRRRNSWRRPASPAPWCQESIPKRPPAR